MSFNVIGSFTKREHSGGEARDIKEERRGIENCAKVSSCLYHHNAVAKLAITRVGFKLVEQHPYPPDLDPNDYRLFPK